MKLRKSIPGEMDMAQERPASAVAVDRLTPCFVLISTNAFLSFVKRLVPLECAPDAEGVHTSDRSR